MVKFTGPWYFFKFCYGSYGLPYKYYAVMFLGKDKNFLWEGVLQTVDIFDGLCGYWA
jgi:hypothetical protein